MPGIDWSAYLTNVDGEDLKFLFDYLISPLQKARFPNYLDPDGVIEELPRSVTRSPAHDYPIEKGRGLISLTRRADLCEVHDGLDPRVIRAISQTVVNGMMAPLDVIERADQTSDSENDDKTANTGDDHKDKRQPHHPRVEAWIECAIEVRDMFLESRVGIAEPRCEACVITEISKDEELLVCLFAGIIMQKNHAENMERKLQCKKMSEVMYLWVSVVSVRAATQRGEHGHGMELRLKAEDLVDLLRYGDFVDKLSMKELRKFMKKSARKRVSKVALPVSDRVNEQQEESTSYGRVERFSLDGTDSEEEVWEEDKGKGKERAPVLAADQKPASKDDTETNSPHSLAYQKIRYSRNFDELYFKGYEDEESSPTAQYSCRYDRPTRGKLYVVNPDPFQDIHEDPIDGSAYSFDDAEYTEACETSSVASFSRAPASIFEPSDEEDTSDDEQDSVPTHPTTPSPPKPKAIEKLFRDDDYIRRDSWPIRNGTGYGGLERPDSLEFTGVDPSLVKTPPPSPILRDVKSVYNLRGQARQQRQRSHSPFMRPLFEEPESVWQEPMPQTRDPVTRRATSTVPLVTLNGVIPQDEAEVVTPRHYKPYRRPSDPQNPLPDVPSVRKDALWQNPPQRSSTRQHNHRTSEKPVPSRRSQSVGERRYHNQGQSFNPNLLSPESTAHFRGRSIGHDAPGQNRCEPPSHQGRRGASCAPAIPHGGSSRYRETSTRRRAESSQRRNS